MFRRTMCACGKCVQVVDLLPIPLKEMGFLVALRPPSMEPKTLHGHSYKYSSLILQYKF
jgi:hypothetical protein